MSVIMLTACSTTNTTTETENQTGTITETINSKENCKKEIAQYLQEANKNKDQETIKKWNKITVDYIWRLNEEEVFDTSIETIAKACGIHNSMRNYAEWLSFNVWAGEMIPWFDEWVIGMQIWETKTIQILPEQWYWQWSEWNLTTVPKTEIPNSETLSEWSFLYSPSGQKVKVHKITDTDIIIDLNHELAGKTLIFDITTKKIN